MRERFTPSQFTDPAPAALYPLLPAQSALAFVLSPETWPVFRAWLKKEHGDYGSSDASDRADVEGAMAALIRITASVR